MCDFTVQTVQKAAHVAVHTGSRLYTDSASSYRAVRGYLALTPGALALTPGALALTPGALAPPPGALALTLGA